MKAKILRSINNSLYNKDFSAIPFGLSRYRLYIGLFLVLYSEDTENLRSRKKAKELLYDVIKNVELLPDTFLFGKMSFGWEILFLCKQGFIELDSGVQNLLDRISSLSSYSLNGHPFQLSLYDGLFSKGIYKLMQRPNDESLNRYVIDEELIIFVDECEKLLSHTIEHIYYPHHLSLRELNSILYFLKEVEYRKIFPYKARILIDKVNELYNLISTKKTFLNESVYQILSEKKYSLSFKGKDFSEILNILGKLGYYSLLYEDSRLFEFPFQQSLKEDSNCEKNLLKFLKEGKVHPYILCGLGLGLLNLKNKYNDKR